MVEVDLAERQLQRPLHAADDVDQEVDPASSLYRQIVKRSRLVPLADVAPQCHHVAAGRTDRLLGAGETPARNIVDDDLGTLSGEAARHRRAHRPAGRGDDRDFVPKSHAAPAPINFGARIAEQSGERTAALFGRRLALAG